LLHGRDSEAARSKLCLARANIAISLTPLFSPQLGLHDALAAGTKLHLSFSSNEIPPRASPFYFLLGGWDTGKYPIFFYAISFTDWFCQEY